MHDELEAWRQDISQPLQIDIFVDAANEPLIRGALGLQVFARVDPSRLPQQSTRCARPIMFLGYPEICDASGQALALLTPTR